MLTLEFCITVMRSGYCSLYCFGATRMAKQSGAVAGKLFWPFYELSLKNSATKNNRGDNPRFGQGRAV
jgi:hypothetical protein